MNTYVAAYLVKHVDPKHLEVLPVYTHRYHIFSSIVEMRTELLTTIADLYCEPGRYVVYPTNRQGSLPPAWPEVQVEHADGTQLSNAEWIALMAGMVVLKR